MAIEHQIPACVQAISLARYLARAYPMASPSRLRTALRAKDVRVNGVKAAADATVAGGDTLTLYIDAAHLTGALPALYDDGRLLVVAKPAGLPLDADADGIGADTVVSRLSRDYPGAMPCHRLDAGTGGALLCARDADTRLSALAAFRDHAIEKRYQAVCAGRFEPDAQSGTLRAYLRKDAQRAKVAVRFDPMPGALSIETRYRVLKPDYAGESLLSLVEVMPVTGRTHQIRAHMAAIGHPLLGDDKYGDRTLNRLYHIGTPMLWCTALTPRFGDWNGLAVLCAPQFPTIRRTIE